MVKTLVSIGFVFAGTMSLQPPCAAQAVSADCKVVYFVPSTVMMVLEGLGSWALLMRVCASVRKADKNNRRNIHSLNNRNMCFSRCHRIYVGYRQSRKCIVYSWCLEQTV